MRLLAGAGPLVAALMVAAAPVAAAKPPGGADAIDDYPISRGIYTTADDFYQAFFQTPDDRGCGVGQQGTVTCRTYGGHGFILSSVYSVLW